MTRKLPSAITLMCNFRSGICYILSYTIEKTLKASLIFILDFYRNYISCLMLPRCRFSPTCSAYARQAIEHKGLWRGLAMSFRRLLRCHPFNRAPFYDPVDK